MTSQADLEEFLVEVDACKLLDHPNIVNFHDAYLYNNAEHECLLWIVMDFCEGGALDDIYSDRGIGLTEPEIKAVAGQLCRALSYVHSRHMYHRDIKGGNLLLTSGGAVKLADFGSCSLNKRANKKHHTVVGSPCWMAPEVIECQIGQRQNHYNHLADVWSFGITLIELAETEAPHQRIHPMKAMMNIVRMGPPTLTASDEWSADCRDFLACCLQKTPPNRIEAKTLLEHQWFSGADFKRPLVDLYQAVHGKESARTSGGDCTVLARTQGLMGVEREDVLAGVKVVGLDADAAAGLLLGVDGAGWGCFMFCESAQAPGSILLTLLGPDGKVVQVPIMHRVIEAPPAPSTVAIGLGPTEADPTPFATLPELVAHYSGPQPDASRPGVIWLDRQVNPSLVDPALVISPDRLEQRGRESKHEARARSKHKKKMDKWEKKLQKSQGKKRLSQQPRSPKPTKASSRSTASSSDDGCAAPTPDVGAIDEVVHGLHTLGIPANGHRSRADAVLTDPRFEANLPSSASAAIVVDGGLTTNRAATTPARKRGVRLTRLRKRAKAHRRLWVQISHSGVLVAQRCRQ